MTVALPTLRNPPIVEAVLDIDCDLSPGFDLAALEANSRTQFSDQYSKSRTLFQQEIEVVAGTPHASSRRAVQAFQFLHEDEKQLVQVRANGFSFNRLAPYTSLDDYLPEIERVWHLYVDLASPVEIRVIRLRYINRILVPMMTNTVDLDEFLTVGPRLPEEGRFVLSGFLIQQTANEKETGHQVNLVLTAQPPENERLPLILDIAAANRAIGNPRDWSRMRTVVESLRRLKNRVFFTSLTPKCIALFQT